MKEIAEAFDILRKKFKGYEDRPQQLEMAGEVFSCLRGRENLLVEAGTGVGKSFAYLIPAVLSGEKTTVSTASIALQDQLVQNDLAFLQKFLPRSFSFALLKGKNNYLCLKREREFSGMGENYEMFCKWASATETGDRDELSFIPDFWAMVCGDSDDCNSVMCPFYGDCFYYRHYRGLRKVDILVVNHHLLIYDLLSGCNLLPHHGRLIVDEAHQLEDVISNVYGSSLTRSRVLWLLYRLRGLKIAVDHLLAPVDLFFKAREMSFRAVYPIPDAVAEELKNLKSFLALDKVARKLTAQKESLAGDEMEDRIKTTITFAASLEAVMDDFIGQNDGERIYYLVGNRGLMELKSNMVECRRPFEDLVDGYESVIMTSATMAVGGDFAFMRKRLGIARAEEGAGPVFREMTAGSPFDFKRQCMVYIEKNLPPPVRDDSEAAWEEGLSVIEGLIRASKGRALVLFTSYRHLNYVKSSIGIGYPFKSQGDMPPAKLMDWFKKTPGAVLLATATFWQGIDIKGEKLSLVIIMKMPFGSPGEPVYDERCRRLGNRWFADLALPSAILTLRQGFGRLIRSTGDYGVVAILDPRLVGSSYGGTIISSLPETTIVHTIADVERFFKGRSASQAGREAGCLSGVGRSNAT
ncbi:MAG: helicase C-terminal domain-containing protein [Candidatus Sulfobium sp.]